MSKRLEDEPNVDPFARRKICTLLSVSIAANINPED
jgi:hypothetical protein